MQPRMISDSWSSSDTFQVLGFWGVLPGLAHCSFIVCLENLQFCFLSQGCLCCWRSCVTPHTFYLYEECHWHLDRNCTKCTNHLKYGYFSIKFTNTGQVPILEMMVLGCLFFGRGFCHVAQMGLELEAILLPWVHVCIALSSSSSILLLILYFVSMHACGGQTLIWNVFFYCSSYWDWFSLDPEITNWLDPPNSVLLAQWYRSASSHPVLLGVLESSFLLVGQVLYQRTNSPGPFSMSLISFIISIEENFHFLQKNFFSVVMRR